MMEFDFLMGMGENEIGEKKVYRREAVRGVIQQGGEILMVHTLERDLKFPGGGVEEGECHQETLRREILEETGHEVSSIGRKIGQVVERRADHKDHGGIFEMISHYYLCEGAVKSGEQNLSDYEIELDFQPRWVNMKDAYHSNRKLLEEQPGIRSWVKRETAVLRILMEGQED